MMDIRYSVAVTSSPDLPLRKWNFLGDVWAESHRSAAFKVGVAKGDIVGFRNFSGAHLDGIAFEFSNGVHVWVWF